MTIEVQQLKQAIECTSVYKHCSIKTVKA